MWYNCVGDTPIDKVTHQHLVRLCGRHADSPGHKSTFCTFVGDAPNRQATRQHLVHLCVRRADSPSHKSTFGTLCWRHAGPPGRDSTFGTCVRATRRFTNSQVNILYMCVGDTPIHQVTSYHFVHLCKRHAGSPCHKSTFCTFVWATCRFTR